MLNIKSAALQLMVGKVKVTAIIERNKPEDDHFKQNLSSPKPLNVYHEAERQVRKAEEAGYQMQQNEET